MEKLRSIMLACVGFALFLGLWEIGGRILGSALLAPPSAVAVDYVDLLRQGDMLRELAGSLRQMAVGFLAACIVGMPLGVAMGRSDVADAIFRPWVSMFVVTSTAALIPLFILTIGTGFMLRVTIVFLASVWYIVLTAYNGARGVSPMQVAVARSFGAGTLQIFWKVTLPAIYPFLITGARIGLVHAIRAMVLAEMFVIIGYGGLIHRSGLLVDTGPVLGLLITLMIVSLFFNWLLGEAGRRLAPWYEQQRVTL
ncbi:ABC transporter permease [Ancylobacter mangrovi]|uniref:ABC transporter permease subunit n=1 Tax=Ancylobacter mangrovi TaxID=2972472 RepID=A0A9X2PP14_9HYPH|nr:ABC transporter permease subunit [Ancylobacter mangrovi]MCS0497218.1 ABC transporter permease subunit [Ancylobacter mangrovi]MCS0505042.1 ABC transporter permease subunit [Ancylobacter mangrovi]